MSVAIVAACDPGFAQHLAVMLLSLADANPRHAITVFVLWNGPSDEGDKLRRVLESTLFQFSIIDLGEGALDDLADGVNFTVTTYARLLIDELLPRDLERVLYLDGDILVRGDIGELWTTDLRGRTVGAVMDLPRYPFNGKLGLPADAAYFNAGVLVIDMGRWRQLRIGERTLALAREHPERLTWADQCALNLVLHGDWTALDRVWNFQSLDMARLVNGNVRFEAVDPGRLAAARLVHFNGRSKPWHYLNDHPLKPDYLRYRSRTPWPLVHFEDRHPRNIARKYLLRYAPGLLAAYGDLRRRAGWESSAS
ncbi:MAG TPA: glycosyltransferase family 8 protein [Stellaceae bacterium]|nr:glycosyltransferase family 8 protein [Stellaceae bacterium]